MNKSKKPKRYVERIRLTVSSEDKDKIIAFANTMKISLYGLAQKEGLWVRLDK